MDLIDVVRIVGGLVLLVGGGEFLVRGASSLATRVGMSSLVVGLTVVSVATSAPELAVSLGAVWRDEPDLAVGNVVGSNIVNVLLVLGISALIIPLAVRIRLVRFDLPFMVGMSVLLLVLALDGGIGTVDGIILLAVLVVHTGLTVVIARRGGGEEPVDVPPLPTTKRRASIWLSLLFVAVGVAMLVLGANLLVQGAVNVATAFGVGSLVVGLTVVAIGTSLPELATSIVALRRGERDLAVGNVVGSNIANIGLVLGLPAVLASGGIPVAAAAIALDIPLMIAAALALLPIAFTGFIVARWEGGLFVALYLAYTGFLILAATRHAALEGFTDVMAWFVLPLVAVTLIAFAAYEVGVIRGRREAREGPRGTG